MDKWKLTSVETEEQIRKHSDLRIAIAFTLYIVHLISFFFLRYLLLSG